MASTAPREESSQVARESAGVATAEAKHAHLAHAERDGIPRASLRRAERRTDLAAADARAVDPDDAPPAMDFLRDRGRRDDIAQLAADLELRGGREAAELDDDVLVDDFPHRRGDHALA